MLVSSRYLLVVGYVPLLFVSAAIGQDEPVGEPKLSKQETQFFESKIRPVLVDRCYSCHSADANSAEGGLRLDSREAMMRGGSGGPSVVAGDPKASLLIRAIQYEDDDFAMPPADSGGKLTDEQIKDFVRWVRMGAPDPRREAEHLRPTTDTNSDARSWWAYQPIQNPTVPPKSDWSWNEIDQFISASHSQHGLKPVVDAAPETLLRRLYFDLIGLPPTPREQQEFQAMLKSGKSRQEAISIVVDRLLDSDQFGAQWGRHWLDVARYAESTGRDVNLPYNNAWRYRDYVIDAFNQGMPFDRFLVSQIAGDLLPASEPAVRARNLIATGFLAAGSRNINEMNAKQYAVDQADEQIDAVFQATMATTFACARCHDHKFDPISQNDYTAVAGIFLSTDTHFGVTGGPKARNGASAIDLPVGHGLPVAHAAMSKDEFKKKQGELASLRAEIAETFRDRAKDRRKGKEDEPDRRKQLEMRRRAAEAGQIDFELSAFDDTGAPKGQAMGVLDKPMSEPREAQGPARFVRYLGGNTRSAFSKIDDSPFFARGDIDMPGNKVGRSVPNLFGDASKFKIPKQTSGRLELAQWIISPENPLTARVAVNRVWHWMMGQGIVSTVDNFGTTGTQPSNPELLDYMATEFKNNDWSFKALIRKIATSRTYQLSSIVVDKDNAAKDPENQWCWKAKSRRLQAEEIRDALLAVTGRLDTTPQIGTTMSKHNSNRVNPGLGRKRNRGEIVSDDVCRSIYLPLPRSAAPEVLELFDLPDAAAVQGAREATNVPSQALFLLNNPSLSAMAGALIKESMAKYPPRGMDKFDERLVFLYESVLARKPNSDEERLARKLLIQSAGPEGWVSIVRGLFATAEFRYLD
jgi:cytochrome c553